MCICLLFSVLSCQKYFQLTFSYNTYFAKSFNINVLLTPTDTFPGRSPQGRPNPKFNCFETNGALFFPVEDMPPVNPILPTADTPPEIKT